MTLSTVHYQDFTNEGEGVFTFSSCWGEHWCKSMSQLKQDLIHEFGTDYELINMDSLTDLEFKALELIYVSQ